MPLLLAITLSAVALVTSIALVVLFLIRLPPTYFHPSLDRRFMEDRHWALRTAAVVIKNAAGVLLVLLGIVMSLPVIPGQGLLTLLVGIMLVDFPGKRALEYRIIRQPRILRAVNRLRRMFSKPPLVLD
jgi:hypothetical protein